METIALSLTRVWLVVGTTIDNPSVDPDVVGSGAARTIYNAAWTFLLYGGGIAVIIGAGLLAFGKINQHQQTFTAGLWTIGAAAIAMAVGASAGAIVNWGAGMDL